MRDAVIHSKLLIINHFFSPSFYRTPEKPFALRFANIELELSTVPTNKRAYKGNLFVTTK